jgi:hypothetical protein
VTLMQKSESCNSSKSILSLVFLCILNGCSYSFPVEGNCEKRLLNSLGEFAKWDHVHTRLQFDYSNAMASKAEAILKNGYADSGQPNLETCVGNCRDQNLRAATEMPVADPVKKEISLKGPSGRTKEVISQACALESKGVWIKSVTYSPFNPADAEMNKIPG